MQIAPALLARQHVLLAGPPGTAKSQLASAVFGRILDEATGRPSLHSRQIGESTVRTDLIGPPNFKSSMEVVRIVRSLDLMVGCNGVCLRGNHEDAWLRVVERGWPEFVLPPGNGCFLTAIEFPSGTVYESRDS